MRRFAAGCDGGAATRRAFVPLALSAALACDGAESPATFGKPDKNGLGIPRATLREARSSLPCASATVVPHPPA